MILGLVLHGLGIGARLVASFTDALQTAMQVIFTYLSPLFVIPPPLPKWLDFVIENFFRSSGLPNDLETYGMVSGLWTSSFALGAFIGPTVSGVLYDKYGFADASLFLIILVFVMVNIFPLFRRK